MYAHLEIEALRVPKAGLMDREKFIAELDELTPAEIETRLASWDLEKLVLAREHLATRAAAPPGQPEKVMWREYHLKIVTERTIAAGVLALGLVLAALIVGGSYKVTGTSIDAYVVNRFTGATWQCADVCVPLKDILAGGEEVTPCRGKGPACTAQCSGLYSAISKTRS